MNYRRFGRLDWEVSALGFGAMRLPVIENDQSKINEPEAIKMIRHAVDRGVNYIDTAYGYHQAKSEGLVGQALNDGYRDKVRLATKLPAGEVNSGADFDRVLNEQLKRLGTDHIDFYLLHGLNKANWIKLRDLEVLKWAEGAITEGRINYLGFSFHDDLAVFKEIIDANDKWTFCQIQYNFMDQEYQAGTEGLKYAADKGLAVVVMEPLRGGQLSKEPPEKAVKLWEKAAVKRTPADWALQWVWNQPEVSTALSGMSTIEHVAENVESAAGSGVGTLTDEESALIGQVREVYRNLSPIPCTDCKYCLPCPNGVSIPRIFELYNEGYIYGDHRRARYFYRQLPKEEQADCCVECEECMDVCPQDFPIPEWLEKCHGWLGPKK